MERLFHSKMTPVLVAGKSGAERLQYSQTGSFCGRSGNWGQYRRVSETTVLWSCVFMYFSPWEDADAAHPVSGTSWAFPPYCPLPPLSHCSLNGVPVSSTAKLGNCWEWVTCTGKEKELKEHHPNTKNYTTQHKVAGQSSVLRAWALLKMASVLGDPKPLSKPMLHGACSAFGLPSFSSWGMDANLGGHSDTMSFIFVLR